MTHNILKSLAVLALGAMLLTAFRPMSKGEHELVGNWQYVKSTVAIHWDDPAPFHDSAAQDEEKSERKDMTINADGSMTMVASIRWQRVLENRPVERKHACLCCGQAF